MCEKQKSVLEEDGAEALPFSLIYTEELETPELEKELEAGDCTWAVFTSRNGVELFQKALRRLRIDLRRLSSLRFAVIGEGTKAALSEAGIYADFVPSRYSSADLAAEWIPTLSAADKVLLLRAQEASSELPDALSEAGISYRDLPLYRTVRDERKAEELNRQLVGRLAALHFAPTASNDVTRDLPTPPLPLTTPMTFLTLLSSFCLTRKLSLPHLDEQLSQS